MLWFAQKDLWLKGIHPEAPSSGDCSPESRAFTSVKGWSCMFHDLWRDTCGVELRLARRNSPCKLVLS
jgi:hypothetical protein